MSIGDLRENKLISLALHGYTPFCIPDIGILCGGYQGPLYPNPTTLTYPGFDPYQYTIPAPTIYFPDTNYTGLGVGNPGIDYKNPGHILGLLDTFGRMSYGLAMWQLIYDGNDINGDIDPVTNIQIPFINMTEEGGTVLDLNDIYPSLSELPTDWINSFEILSNGRVQPDPRPMSAFANSPAHTAIFSAIDEDQFNRLFTDKTVFSYIGMPQYLRSVIETLSNAASAMESQSEFGFMLPDEEAADFNYYSHQSLWHQDLPTNYKGERDSEGKIFVQCKSATPAVALKTLTGEDTYHSGDDNLNEYRSLTELNSVINLMPAHMIAATYWTDTKGYMSRYTPIGGWEYYVGPETGRDFVFASIMIVDLTINISDIPIDLEDQEPGEVTIQGEAIIHSPISNPTDYYYGEDSTWYYSPAHIPPHDPIEYHDYEYGCRQSLRKTIRINTSMTNSYGWDKIWIGGGETNGQDSEYETFEDEVLDGGIEPLTGFETCDQTPLTVSFTHNYTMGAGCTAIRMRAFLQNRHSIGMIAAPLWTPWLTGPVSPAPGITYVVNSSGPTGNPDDVPGNLNSPHIQFSFTVTGTKMNPLEYEFSV